ncbi:MAG: antibiotic biosynthesis monooxygenase [Bauldia sp.]|uniref:antibiotic biosynthesis monooxygenase family protein n=1 Tax=Bauldia sp. TaxID=2575872 RepID=UPI001DB2094F|nr:antibiotic biosynthesis monooxygenase [Bauldia sp.]MCB1494216.1 antibiotic biosynthesis monooxygenase [Bauldia sp.]
MIVRIFRVWVKAGCAADWQRMVEEHSIPWMRSQAGCVAFFAGKPLEPDGLEFSMTSVWTDTDAIKRAVGENWQEAILFGDEARIAERVEMHHYEVFGGD